MAYITVQRRTKTGVRERDDGVQSATITRPLSYPCMFTCTHVEGKMYSTYFGTYDQPWNRKVNIEPLIRCVHVCKDEIR